MDVGGRPSNRLLSGSDIKAAKDWAARRQKNAPAPTELQLEFFRESEAEDGRRQSAEHQRLEELAETIAAREAAVQAAQTAQRDKEAAQARETERAKRAARNALFGLVVAVVLMAAAAVAAYYAFRQKSEAELQTMRAEQAARDATAAK